MIFLCKRILRLRTRGGDMSCNIGAVDNSYVGAVPYFTQQELSKLLESSINIAEIFVDAEMASFVINAFITAVDEQVQEYLEYPEIIISADLSSLETLYYDVSLILISLELQNEIQVALENTVVNISLVTNETNFEIEVE